MKKLLTAALGLAALASVATAQTNVVLSRNAVGYVKIDLIATNKLHLIRNDFVGLNGPIAISNALASLPVNSQVTLWDKSNQVYRPPIIRGVFGWGVGGSNRLNRGESFFLRTPNAATNVPSFPLYLMGEVPDKFTAPTTTLVAANGINLEGHPYPVSTRWTNTTLSQVLPINSQIVTWNLTNQAYNAPIIKGVFGWGAAGNALVLDPGQGFVIRTTNLVVYNVGKPYTWP